MGCSMYPFIPQAGVIAVGVAIPSFAIHGGEIYSSTRLPTRTYTPFEALCRTSVCGLEGQERAFFVGPM